MDDSDDKKLTTSDEGGPRRSVDAPSDESNDFVKRNYKYTEEFLDVMKIYQESFKDPSVRALNLRGRHTWEEVIQEARLCEARYLHSGRKGPRKLVRSFSTNADLMTPWLRLIPNDMCFVVLGGGLKLVFGAATRISDMHEIAISQLLRIPMVISDAEESCKTFGRDSELFAYAEQLYLAALAAIEGTTEWLQQGILSHPLRSIFRGPLYSKSLQDKIKSLDDALSALQNRVSILRDGSIRRTERAVQNVESVLTKMSTQEPGNRQKISDALEEMKEMLADKTRTAKWMNKKNIEIMKIKKQIQHIQRSKSLSPEDLLDILDVHKTHPEYDLRRILRRTTPDDGSDEIALGLTKGQKFSQWHAHDESAALFIEGSISSTSDSDVPFTSLISSYFVESVKQYSMCVYFFCGHHTRATPKSSDSLSGPSGMMRSLIAQTVRESRLEVDFIPTYLRSKLESLDFRALCTCFKLIVQNLPIETVLFCIIDGISDFEKREWSEDSRKAIDDLQDLTYDAGMNAIFKLLVTSPARSRKVGDLFKAEERLQLDEDVWNDRDGRDFPTEREIVEGRRRSSTKQHLRRSLREQHQSEWPEEDDHDVTAPSDSC